MVSNKSTSKSKGKSKSKSSIEKRRTQNITMKRKN